MRSPAKRQTVQLTLWVKPGVKAELQRIAEAEGITPSRTGAVALEEWLAHRSHIQHRGIFQPMIERAIAKEVGAYSSRIAFLLVRCLFLSEQTRAIAYNNLRKPPGLTLTEEMLDKIMDGSKNTALRNIGRVDPELTPVIQAMATWLEARRERNPGVAMAIVKASYTRTGGKAKATVRYIEHRPGKDGARLVRTLFTADGKVERREVYAMIDQAAKGSYFYRLVISPDPRAEDGSTNLSLRDITERTIASLEDRFQLPLQWVAAVHADHAAHRHIHALAILPQHLNVPDLQRLRRAATEAALEQRRQLDLAREHRAVRQERSDGWELSW